MSDNFLIYNDDAQTVRVEAHFEDETVWLTQRQIVELFQSSKATVSEHIKNIYTDEELLPEATVRKIRTVQQEGTREVARNLEYYNLDMIIALGYRINSKIATQFRIWATNILKEYLKKGFVLNDERLKNLGGGNYWKELLDRIRDIRSSEKVMYRQVLDLYATATDYDSNSETSQTFFKIVQNKLHYAAHGNTASEVIYLRVDSDKPFAGVMSFKGDQPTQAEAMIAKNYLSEQELKVLNNLVSAYFDLAELNAIEERAMTMVDYVEELDRILSSTGRKVLDNAGKISMKQAKEKAKVEYRQYKGKNLAQVEQDYLKTITSLEHQAKKESRKK
ncbi:virulence RhuM family protein [Wohlfahrtiimonas chitiniclastica]|uniref:Virulence RhuM family protein n=1 Tax=Wohlfahrtiimonas chitiniclastica TaxID=400946 RepID=A0AB35BXT9_9GAMM|nr:virulence RhuM family protein [Wohlfahrtiimonas chitiniclastica]MBS7825104.1 virulence RhuM family protein [Wohlfahrtiimonas chitiniclastica]MBS7839699.1 virulence RhuM family protein [Wohlfahrtiimonas chitiniclastica]